MTIPRLPHWPPRDWRSLLALVFSVLGAVALTGLVGMGLGYLLPDRGWTPATEAARISTISWVLWISTAFIGIVLVGLGMAINRRSLRLRSGDKSAEFEGGDDEPAEPAGEPPAPAESDIPTRPDLPAR